MVRQPGFLDRYPSRDMDAASFKVTAKNMLEAILGMERQENNSGETESLSFDGNLPAVLRAFYEVADNSLEVLASHHRFVPAADLRHEDGIIFCEENERVVLWGIETRYVDEIDPPVSQWNTTSEFWCDDCPSLSLFLLNMICWQVLNAAPSMAQSQYDSGIHSWTRKHLLPACEQDDRYDLESYYGEGIVACFLLPALFFLGCGSEAQLIELERKIGTDLNWL